VENELDCLGSWQKPTLSLNIAPVFHSVASESLHGVRIKALPVREMI